MAQAADQPSQIAHRGAQPDSCARPARLADPQEERHHEDGIPDRHERPDKARPLAGLGIQTEKRRDPGQRPARRRFGEQGQHQRQRDDAAHIAEGKARPGQAPDLVARGKAGQHGIGEDGGEFHADQADAEQRDRGDQRRLFGDHEPQPRGAQDIQRREQPDPGHPASRGVGHRPQDRRQNRDHDAADRQTVTPQRLRTRPRQRHAVAQGDEMAFRDLGEIDREDEGQQQRGIGLAGPVEKPPAPDPLAVHLVPRSLFRHKARGGSDWQVTFRAVGNQRRPGPCRIGVDPGLHPAGQVGAADRMAKRLHQPRRGDDPLPGCHR